MTNIEDALIAVDAGADAVGFVFYEKSPRNISVETAREIILRLPQNIEKVGVFVNECENAICSVAERSALTAVQMHGDNEDPHVADLVKKLRPQLKVLVAISMYRSNPAGWGMMWDPRSVHAFLLDSGTGSKHGGTGTAFDWHASAPIVKIIGSLGRVVAAGGLTAESVGTAIGVLEPWGVDVSSGVEAAPGKKDHKKVRAFVNAVREADRRTG